MVHPRNPETGLNPIIFTFIDKLKKSFFAFTPNEMKVWKINESFSDEKETFCPLLFHCIQLAFCEIDQKVCVRGGACVSV
jgi:hypothetical protein